MSALSAIETPVAESEARDAAAPDLGRSERVLQAVANQVLSVPAEAPEDDSGDGQPRSSSIPVAGSRTAPGARRPAGHRRPAGQQHERRSGRAVSAGASVASAGVSRTRLRMEPTADGTFARAAAITGAAGSNSHGPRPRPAPSAGSDAQRSRPRTAPAMDGSAAHARLRLTRRGRFLVTALLLGAVTLAALLITVLASGGAEATNHGPARGGYQGMHQVVVRPGQTLWSIAAAAAPTADPRSVVQEIMSANALSSPAISAGQQLWVP
jgi:hypothetical protein